MRIFPRDRGENKTYNIYVWNHQLVFCWEKTTNDTELVPAIQGPGVPAVVGVDFSGKPMDSDTFKVCANYFIFQPENPNIPRN